MPQTVTTWHLIIKELRVPKLDPVDLLELEEHKAIFNSAYKLGGDWKAEVSLPSGGVFLDALLHRHPTKAIPIVKLALKTGHGTWHTVVSKGHTA